MTEKEASVTPCIGPVPQNTGILRQSTFEPARYCCSGSRCLGWRWHKNAADDPDVMHRREIQKLEVTGVAQVEPAEVIEVDDDVGYCGIAGVPT